MLSNLVLRRFLKTVTESHGLREQSKEFHNSSGLNSRAVKQRKVEYYGSVVKLLDWYDITSHLVIADGKVLFR